MEWPSSRIDNWAIALFLVGCGGFAMPDVTMAWKWRFAIVLWFAAGLFFVCGSPAVQRWLRTTWDKLLFLYRQKAGSYPWGAPVGAGLVLLVLVMLLSGGGWWLLKPQVGDPEPRIVTDLSKGSLRFGREEIHPLVVGEEFKVNWDVVNPGPGRIFNMWPFYRGYIEEVDGHTDEKVMTLFEDDLSQYRKNPPQGQEVGPGEDMFFTIRTPPITQQQYEGILKGTTLLYFVAWVRWTDAQGGEDPPLSRCMRLYTKDLQPLDLPRKAVWVFCTSSKRSPS